MGLRGWTLDLKDWGGYQQVGTLTLGVLQRGAEKDMRRNGVHGEQALYK